MTEDLVKNLQKEKSQLEIRLFETTNQVADFEFKLDATSSFMSDIINDNIMNRTNTLKLNKNFQDTNQKLSSAQQLIAALNRQLTAANAKIAELDAKVKELTPAPKLELVEDENEQKANVI